MTALLPWLHMVLCTCMSGAPGHYCHCAAASKEALLIAPSCGYSTQASVGPVSGTCPQVPPTLAGQRLKGKRGDVSGPKLVDKDRVRLPQVSLTAQGSPAPSLAG